VPRRRPLPRGCTLPGWRLVPAGSRRYGSQYM